MQALNLTGSGGGGGGGGGRLLVGVAGVVALVGFAIHLWFVVNEAEKIKSPLHIEHCVFASCHLGSALSRRRQQSEERS